jgi:methyl-accepting chemotaxis protein
MEKVRQRRRIKVVDGRLQYRMIAVNLFLVLAGLLVFAALTALYYLVILQGGGAAARPELLLVVLPPLLLNDLAIMVLVIVVGIFTTHRIAGPIYRLESDIDRVLSGERGVRTRLRRKDAFPDLAEKVNQLIERIDDQRKG